MRYKMSDSTNFERKLDAAGNELSITPADAVQQKNVANELMTTVSQIRKFVEEGQHNKSEVAEMSAKVEKKLAELDDANKKLHEKYFTEKEKEEARLGAIEDQLMKNVKNSPVINQNGEFSADDKAYTDSFWKYALTSNTSELFASDAEVRQSMNTKGRNAIDVSPVCYSGHGGSKKLIQLNRDQYNVKYVRTDIDPLGGYLTPPELSNNLLKNLTEYSNIRKLATTRTTYSNVLEQPVRNVLVSSGWGYEAIPAADMVDSQSSYLNERIPIKVMYGKVELSLLEQQTSAFDMQAEISNDMTTSFAKTEGAAFVNGSGPKQPEGLLTKSGVASINSGSADSLTPDSLIKVYGELKYEGYEGTYDRTYIFNRRTWVDILLKKSGFGQYLWNANALDTGLPNTIMGQTYAIVPDMPDIAPGATPVMVGDFRKGYLIVDRMQMYMVRDEVTKPGVIKFNFFRFVGAKVVLTEAFCKIAIAA